MPRTREPAARIRPTLDDMNPDPDEPVVYLDREGNEVESQDELTDGGRILRGEDAQKYIDGEAIPQYGILSVDEAEEREKAKSGTKTASDKDASRDASDKSGDTEANKSS